MGHVDKHIQNGCSKRRPDLLLDVGHKPLVFLRFNPDDYVENVKQVASCCGKTTKVFVLSKNQNKMNGRGD